MTRRRCEWCADATASDWSDTLCETHEAEYLGESVASLRDRRAWEHAEWADAYVA